jgi:hypothetical protein
MRLFMQEARHFHFHIFIPGVALHGCKETVSRAHQSDGLIKEGQVEGVAKGLERTLAQCHVLQNDARYRHKLARIHFASLNNMKA